MTKVLEAVDDILSAHNEVYCGYEIRKRLTEAGYAIVPERPTLEMLCAGSDAIHGDGGPPRPASDGHAFAAYKAMLAARPK